MVQGKGSRRAFVGGAVVGVGALGTLALLRREAPAPLPAVAPLAGGAASATVAAAAPASAEIAAWARAVGAPVQVRGEWGSVNGTLDMVLNAPEGGVRPAGLRQHPFYAYFAVDRDTAPRGDRTYAITTPIEGLSQVFLTRGLDRGAKAILVAVFG